jgi:stage V sporulation protein D (sporulation-specific penicillin-binding protein)
MKKRVRKRISYLKRWSFFVFLVFGCFTLLFLKLSYLKIFQSDEYLLKAQALWTRSAPISGARGKIYDCNGTILVGNRLCATIVIIPKQIKDKEIAARAICSVTGASHDAIMSHLDKKVSVEIIKPEGRRIEIGDALTLARKKIEGIYFVEDYERDYVNDSSLAQTIGIVGTDMQGLTGIEYLYDSYLKGKRGSLEIYTDAHGNKMLNLDAYYRSAKSGNDVYLTINASIQASLERVLTNANENYQNKESYGLVMDPMTSQILAITSYPTFELSHYQDYDESIYNQNLPIWKCYEPGSTFKIATFAAALEEKVIKLDEMFYDPGYRIVDGTRIRDWKKGGHGNETFLQVLENSCNPGFMEMGERLGKERLFRYIRLFGYGKKTGVDLLGEATGILFDEDKIGNVEVATSSFGQGNSVTAIQLLNAACCSINGGLLHVPSVLKEIRDGDTVVYKKEVSTIRRVISEETSKIMQTSLESVVALGTGRNAYLDGYRVGGKTGTAQIAQDGHYLDGLHILSFLGLAPTNDAKLGVYVALVEPKNCIQYGGTTVAPLVREILLDSLTILDVKKQKEAIEKEIRPYIDQPIYSVPNFVGCNIAHLPSCRYFTIRVQGNGSTVIAQIPEFNEKLVEGGTIFLYTEGKKEDLNNENE